MKKAGILLLCCVLALTLFACAKEETADANGTTTTTTTTTAASSTTTGEDETTTTTTTTAATTTTTTTTKKPTTTTQKPTTTTTVPAIAGNTWVAEVMQEDNTLFIYKLAFKTNQIEFLACIPWDEAFSADNWAAQKAAAPETAYTYNGKEFYVDADATWAMTANAGGNTATVTYEGGTLQLTRSGSTTLKVDSNSTRFSDITPGTVFTLQ